MNKSYAFTGRSIKFWLGLFNFMTTTKEDGIENFCKTEYGTDWQWAYSHYQKNRSFPSPLKISSSANVPVILSLPDEPVMVFIEITWLLKN